MDDATRRFTANLLIVFAPLFVFGGFLAAFTVDGAVLVFTGIGMLIGGILLHARVPGWIAAMAGIATVVGLCIDLARQMAT